MGFSIEEVAIRKYGRRAVDGAAKTDRDYVGRRFRQALDMLADEWQLKKDWRGSTRRMLTPDARPTAVTLGDQDAAAAGQVAHVHRDFMGKIVVTGNADD